ncbi:hypothetical protein ACXR6G_02930 [Ancylomarina sp. YFZ004]
MNNLNNKRVCLTTFVYGLNYQCYLPFLLYSCHKAYPEYDIVLFLYDELNQDIKKQIEKIGLTNKVVIRERCFNDCSKMTPLKSKSLRWILWDNLFENYDYLYTVDIDMFYLLEPLALHKQHIKHMKFIDLPISNLRRRSMYNPYKLLTFAFRFKHAGFKGIFNFLSGEKEEYKLTGLHFVKIKEYFNKLNFEQRQKFRNQIYTGDYFKYVKFPNNEILLGYIVKQLGFDLNKFGVQTDSVKILDYNTPERSEFRPHHGIHLGIFRRSIEEINKIESDVKILNSPAYRYYIQKMKDDILSDNIFKELIKDAPDNIKFSFTELFKFYDINYVV